MIFVGTLLNVGDNAGAKYVKCIKLLSSNNYIQTLVLVVVSKKAKMAAQATILKKNYILL